MLLDLFVFGIIAAIVPYLILRKHGGVLRSIVAYLAGSVVTFGTMAAFLFYMDSVLRIPPIEANRVFGPGSLATFFGPAFGLWAAKQARKKGRRAGTTTTAPTSMTGIGNPRMNTAQQCLIIGTLCVLAVGLAWHFVEYRAEDLRIDRQMNLVVPQGLILPIRQGQRTVQFPDRSSPFDDIPIATQEGIYARRDYPTPPAAIGGVLLPILLLAAAGYLAFGIRRTTN